MRKRVVIILLAVVVVLAAAFFLTRGIVRRFKGEASPELKDYYNEIKAEDLNNSDIDFDIDGKIIKIANEDIWFREDLEPYICASKLTDVFGCTVDFGDDEISITDGNASMSAKVNADEYFINSDAYKEKDVLIRMDGQLFVSTSALAKAHTYEVATDYRNSVITFKSVSAVLGIELPESYSMVDSGRMPIIRSQGNFGTCWAYASLAALESSLLPDEALIFSEEHLIRNNGFNVSVAQGGDANMALSYYAAWTGPVSISGRDVSKHIQEAVMINAKDYKTIKEMIINFGGVESSFYSDITKSDEDSEFYNVENGCYYYNGNEDANHDIVIVGWDDNYSREKFNEMPSVDGAFLCRNSWGDKFGSNGYFYISYEDTNIGRSNIVYTRIDDIDNYDNIYQTDRLGFVGTLGYNKDTAWFANVYTANSDEVLKAVSFYTLDKDSEYSIYVVPEFKDVESLKDAVLVKSGRVENAGYYTEDILAGIELSEGKDYAVMVKLTTKGQNLPVAVEYDGSPISQTADMTDGRGYISSDGNHYERVEERYGCNICLKAFTDKR